MRFIGWTYKRFQRLPIIRLGKQDKEQEEGDMNINKGLASLGICAAVIVAVIVTGEPNVLWGLVALYFVW